MIYDIVDFFSENPYAVVIVLMAIPVFMDSPEEKEK